MHNALSEQTTPRLAMIGVGGNLGDPRQTVERAVEELRGAPWLSDFRASSLYRTSPVGFREQPDFVNAVVVGMTSAPTTWLLAELQRMEKVAGRPEVREYLGPRVLDLDLLTLGSEESDDAHLRLPHPEMNRRRFVLEPLAEILPQWVHPISGVCISDYLNDLPEDQRVTLLEGRE